MALTDSKRTFQTSLTDLSMVVEDVRIHFEERGYSVSTESTPFGAFISMTQGGIFKTVSGMKTGLNIEISQLTGAVEVSMKVGIFGKQVLPSYISVFVFWPMLIPQIFGLVKQNKLDEEAFQTILESIRKHEKGSDNADYARGGKLFCPYCGKSVPADSAFCPECGKNISGNTVCPKCGGEIVSGSVFCNKCGAKLNL